MRSLLVILAFLAAGSVLAQAPDTLWTQTYGGGGSEWCRAVEETADGGFILAGQTNGSGAGGFDMYLIKTDRHGIQVWERTYGGSSDDYCFDVRVTADGGYILGGTTQSSGAGGRDMYLVKVNGAGNLVWEGTFGGAMDENCYSVWQTRDGGYILGGETSSMGAGETDMYAVRTDANGNLLWQRTYGFSAQDECQSVQQTSEGGFIFAGSKYTDIGSGNFDFYLVKTDSMGNPEWERTLGGTDFDICNSVQQTPDGGYILGGEAFGTMPSLIVMQLMKVDSAGNMEWTQIFGGYLLAWCNEVDQTADGGYVMACLGVGLTVMEGDMYLIKTDSQGNQEWVLQFGGTGEESGDAVKVTADEGYILAGMTQTFGMGSNDFYVVRLEGQSDLVVSLTPQNPPIMIPGGGGVFQYTASVENTTANLLQFDAWTEVVLPNGAVYGPIILRQRLGIPAGAVILRNLTQNVPGSAPPGNYTYTGKVGVYPDSVVSCDDFPFTKLAGEGISSYEQGWALYGWDSFEPVSRGAPVEPILMTASPNPFNPSTAIGFELRVASQIRLAVYDVSGREAAVLVEGHRAAGNYQVVWDASAMASGVYFIHCDNAGGSLVKKVLLVK